MEKKVETFGTICFYFDNYPPYLKAEASIPFFTRCGITCIQYIYPLSHTKVDLYGKLRKSITQLTPLFFFLNFKFDN